MVSFKEKDGLHRILRIEMIQMLLYITKGNLEMGLSSRPGDGNIILNYLAVDSMRSQVSL